MRPQEKQLLDKRLKDFMEEVIPVELFPYLPCLIPQDREEIEATQTNHGPIYATRILVDRLKRRDGGFANFVQALRKCGSAHTALLLDPYYMIKDDGANEAAPDTNGSGPADYTLIGTAIDLAIPGNLLLAGGSEEPAYDCSRFEMRVAERYKDRKSEDNKRIREKFQKRLPQGVVFVNTEKGSIISTFRLSSEKAASELWEMYTQGTFQSMLQEVLMEDALKDDAEKPEKSLELQLSLVKERFEKIRKKLAEIERDQERERSLCFPGEQDNGSFADDADEVDIEIPPVFLGTKANSLGGCELVLRNYQKELAEPAIQGKNTIICAPTNSGKTYVAIEIAKKHLDSFERNADQSNASAMKASKEQPRVVFIVSTVNLVFQQKERFEAFLGDKYSVGEISGSNCAEIPLKFLLQNNDVVVMTAQILVNALKAEERGNRVELKDISLLLFDECHHAHKEHPYNSIMETYLALKSQAGHQHRLPQIVGLTASLGTGKAKSREKAKEHIILVSANLDAEAISTVKENREELEKYVNIPSREAHFVPKDEQDPFEKIISKVMGNIEAQVKKFKQNSCKAPVDKGGQQYRQWVEQLYKDSVAEGDRYLVTYTEHLREYHVALTLNANTRMKNARKYLTKYFEALDTDKFTETDKKLKQLFHKAMKVLDEHIARYGEPQNPRLLKLKELILKNYTDVQSRQDKEEDKSSKSSGEGSGRHEGGQDDTDEKIKERDAGNELLKNDEKQKEEGIGGENEASAVVKETERCECDVSKNDTSSDKAGKTPPEDVSGHASKTQDGTSTEEVSQTIDGAGGLEYAASEQSEAQNEVDTVMEEVNEQGSETNESTSSDGAEEDKALDEQRAHHPEWEGPKGILFTRTRESTEALLDWIKETEELNAVLRPEHLVGSGDGNIGMTQKEQEEVIKRFKTGEKNLLLATSVAEEGLDISDCNYVIRYDMMGNEISSVQSRGRVRAKDGKYTVLVGHSGAKKRDTANNFREILMTDALNLVQNMKSTVFIKTVKEVQRKIIQDRSLKKLVRASQKAVFLPDDVNFLCRKCAEFVCQAHDVRRIKKSYYVITNRDCRDNKVDIREHPNPKSIDGIEMNKRIFCKKCHEDWGVTALICSFEWLCIKINSFVVEFPKDDKGDCRRRIFKKWKDLPFAIQEAELEEVLQLGADNSETKDLLDLDL
ncbi:ATP-dependent RNA helicase DHX58-like isoform X2 [Montipora foliosa]|uniref:ATP-dependent RNA helicase DHX58-like isoform X2 n=1 Tax=Montipora foliosa TaxID=591990 RepID=UPI0035F1964C